MDSIFRPSTYLSKRLVNFIGTALVNLLVFLLVAVYLLPVLYGVSTSLKSQAQLSDARAPAWPADAVTFNYQGRDYTVYEVPTDAGLQHWALVRAGRVASVFIDPNNPQAGLFEWQRNWRTLEKVYEPNLHFENFSTLWEDVDFGRMFRNTALIGMLSGIGSVLASIAVAYGLSRFNIPGERIILLVLIGTLLIPEKVILIPTYFAYATILHWTGTIWPLVLPHLFGNAAFIFLLRQNFKSIPRDLDEAAMIDGAGPLRVLLYIILPQAKPAVVTVALLHFFYAWNETRLTSLFLGSNAEMQTVAYGLQNYQSFLPIAHLLQASTLIVMAIPIVVLFLSQRIFMRDLVVTGLEK